ncbi:sulfite exporter TauE/SafE family protein [Altererythrobacter lutimaris]|uniref:Probable membrane transporter protein n=1 Tax=Altererythrobacter lutimaris TaxID=2743979 RepID=A0A850HJ27_9SPHN|nr:sulfite exporter TauE/SafE family protein [Altererythrobacter lutimaris]NVE95992.1 sulfite exporter TauE/SafE family protein [Altererythrobacter lutimaris]
MELLQSQLGEILPFILIGFLAQLVDGALGMAFGAIATTLLVGFMGVPPAQASYKVHVIKILTSGVSGISHAFSGNIHKRLFLMTLLPGILGGAIGAYGLSQIDGETVKPFVFVYLFLLGLLLVFKGAKGRLKRRAPRAIVPLGFAGGILDAIGGGGWGPVVSSGLMLQGTEPRKVVGSVNSVEFFVAIAISGAFLGQFGFEALAGATLGLLIGGVLAAPFGAIAARYLPAPIMLVLVGAVLSLTTGYWLVISLL